MMLDPLTMSLRDLALMMMSVSDNAATDVVCATVGLDRVNATMALLGLTDTVVGGDCRDLFATMTADAGVSSVDEFEVVDEALLDRIGALDPARSLQRTTPRDITRLLQLVWDDEAAPAEACADIRRILGAQVWPHRLASGFPEDEITTSGKTGTLPRIRNEVGVVEYPDGGRYAVACFTTASRYSVKNPAQDAVIGRAARVAVDALRADR
jgi:beta-lactamase class A